MKSRIIGLVKLTRIPTVLAMNAFMFVPIWTITNSISKALLSTLPFVFLISGEIVLNDYFGIDIDKISKPHRPLAAGTFSRKFALFLSLALIAVASFSAFFVFRGSAIREILFFTTLCLLSIYNAPVFFISFFKTIITALLVVVCLYFPYTYSQLPIKNTTIVFLFAAFFFILGREMAMDIRDLDGDSKNNYQTMAVVLGERVALHISGFAFLCAIISTVILIIMDISVGSFIVAGIIAAVQITLFILYVCMKEAKRRNVICLLMWIPMLLSLYILFM